MVGNVDSKETLISVVDSKPHKTRKSPLLGFSVAIFSSLGFQNPMRSHSVKIHPVIVNCSGITEKYDLLILFSVPVSVIRLFCCSLWNAIYPVSISLERRDVIDNS